MKKFSIVFLVVSFIAVFVGMNLALRSNKAVAEAISFVSNPMDESSQWAYFYRGPETDGVYAVAQASDGGFVMVGNTDSFGSGNMDLWVVKLNADGSVLWEKTYGNDNLEYASDITEADNGDLLVAGSTFVYSGQGIVTGYWILRLSGTGDMIWQKRFPQVFSDENDLLETSDHGIIIAGGWNEGTSIMKLDFDGNVIWQKSYDDQVVLFDGMYFSVDETLDGGIIATFPRLEGDQWLAKLDPQGNIEWQKLLSGGSYRVSVNAIGNVGFYVSGGTQTNSIVLRLDPSGNIIWQKSLTLTSSEYLWSADTTNDGGIILAGRSGNTNYFMIRLDADGNLVWSKTYEGGVVKEVEQISNDGYIAVGNKYQGNLAPEYPWALTDENSITQPEAFPTLDGNYDISVFKIDANGNINGCSYIQTANTMITDTNVILVDAFVTPIVITPNPADSFITPQTSNITPELICYFSPTSTMSPTNTPTITLTPSPTQYSTPTYTPTIALTASPIPTNTSTPTPTETNTPTLDNQTYLPIIYLP